MKKISKLEKVFFSLFILLTAEAKIFSQDAPPEPNTVPTLPEETSAQPGMIDAPPLQEPQTVEPVQPVAGSNADPALQSASTNAEATEGPTNLRKQTNDPIELFMESERLRNFIGKPINLQVRNADVNDVMRMISEASGFNIVLGMDVKGTLTLSLTDVPWDQALDIVFSTLNLGAERVGNVLRISLLTTLTAQKSAQLQAKVAEESLAPKVTKIVPINYAKPSDIITSLKSLQPTQSASQPGAVPAQVAVDERTNSVIIQDTQENIDRMVKLIELLDSQTPQVLIEAKIVEIKEGSSSGINGALTFGTDITNGTGIAPTSPSQIQGLQMFGSTPSGSSFDKVNTLSGVTGNFGFSPAIGFLPGVSRLNAFLSLQDTESRAKIIASPRNVVMNKETADITQTITQNIVINGGQGTPGALQAVQTKLSLSVKPTVTNDESVLLELNIQRDNPESTTSSAVTTTSRSMKTKVLVENGKTLVIGGIYILDTSHASSGIPLLRKLPLIGSFFGSETETQTKSELMIFVTPKILNQNKSTLSSKRG